MEIQLLNFGVRTMKRHPTKYPGVFYRIGKRLDGPGEEKIYYAVWKASDGKITETRLGRQYRDGMTPAQANKQRSLLMTGKEKTRKQKREDAKEKRWTLDALWDSYRKTKPDSKSMSVDQNRYENHIKPTLGKKLPSDLVSTDIQKIIQKNLKGKSPQTIKHVIDLIKRLCNYGTNNALCSGPAFKIKAPEVANKVTETLSNDQLKRLLNVLDKSENIQVSNLLKLAMVTGMRRGELFRLEWRDFDFESGIIHLRNPKGKQDVFIPLNDQARAILEGHPHTEGSQYVFPGSDGGQRKTVQAACRKVRKDAQLPENFRMVHGLRHFYASSLVNAGVDLYAVQQLLGHKSPVVTTRYAHLNNERLKSASAKIGDLLDEAQKNNQDAEKSKT